MNALEVIAKAAEIAERYGPPVLDAWKAIATTLRAENPELRAPPREDREAQLAAEIDADIIRRSER